MSIKELNKKYEAAQLYKLEIIKSLLSSNCWGAEEKQIERIAGMVVKLGIMTKEYLNEDKK